MLIIDVNNMMYRALHVFNLSHNGRDVSVLYGMMRMIYKLVTTYRPDSIVACIDNGIPPHRRALVPEYKRGRKKSSEIDWNSVYSQLMELQYIAFPLHGILPVSWPDTEADDLMYHAARLSMSDHSYIVSADKDMLQAVDTSISVINPASSKTITREDFEDVVGVPQWVYLLYKVLVGDGSDNIPGVKSIGPKTAVRMLENIDFFDSLHPFAPSTLRSDPKYPYDVSVLSKRQMTAIDNVGVDGLQAMYACMDLTYDRCGVHKALYDAQWSASDADRVRKWLVAHSFISLLEEGGKYTGAFRRLKRPVFDNDARHPIPLL